MPSWLPFSLVALACPIGMGLMMWFMMRSMREQHGEAAHSAPEAASLEKRLARLEADKRDLERDIAMAKQTEQAGKKEHAQPLEQ